MKGRARSATLSALALLLASALAACTSTQDVFEPSALVSPEQGSAAASPDFPMNAATNEPATATRAPSQRVAAIATNARVRFAPVVGAPDTASASLAGRITTRATERGIGLAAASDTSATHLLKGYFSAISDGGETTVIYVWDVLDPSGTRVHRIQGQAKGPSGRADGWDGVQPATMETIADQTVDQLVTWLAARAG